MGFPGVVFVLRKIDSPVVRKNTKPRAGWKAAGSATRSGRESEGSPNSGYIEAFGSGSHPARPSEPQKDPSFARQSTTKQKRKRSHPPSVQPPAVLPAASARRYTPKARETSGWTRSRAPSVSACSREEETLRGARAQKARQVTASAEAAAQPVARTLLPLARGPESGRRRRRRGGGYFRVRTSSPYKDRGDPVPIAADRPALRKLSRPARYETPDTNRPGDIGACQRVGDGTSTSKKASVFLLFFSVLSETRRARFMRFHNRVL